MITERQKAVARTTAPKKDQQAESYQGRARKSSGKSLTERLAEQVTRLLAYLHNPLLSDAERKQGYRLFDRSLKKYLAVKHLGVFL